MKCAKHLRDANPGEIPSPNTIEVELIRGVASLATPSPLTLVLV
jgi:hypothetical protein